MRATWLTLPIASGLGVEYFSELWYPSCLSLQPGSALDAGAIMTVVTSLITLPNIPLKQPSTLVLTKYRQPNNVREKYLLGHGMDLRALIHSTC